MMHIAMENKAPGEVIRLMMTAMLDTWPDGVKEKVRCLFSIHGHLNTLVAI
jgi:hypothetical protein